MTKNKIGELFRNFSYVIFSNLISVLISILVVLVVPKYIGVSNYGYFQLYILYTTFVGFLHFGWNDGLYLRFGGSKYKDLNKEIFFGQFYLLLFAQICIAVLGFITVYFLNVDLEKKYVLYMTAICMIVVNVRYMLLFLLQATYRIKEYSVITISDRLIYLALILILIFSSVGDFKYFIWVDVIGKVFSLFLSIHYCKDIVLTYYRQININSTFKEAANNITVGIKLMLSNIASKMVVGNVRLGIESVWSIAIFGKISLMLSITGLVMIFINSISLVLFPFLRRVSESALQILYLPLRDTLSIFLLFFLLTYYPVSIGLKVWLPDYMDALDYLLTLYPVIIFEGRVSLIVNTYLKVLRREGLLFKINLISLLFSMFATYLSVYVMERIDFAVYSILIVVFLRSFIAEIYIQMLLGLSIYKEILIDVFCVATFLISNFYFESLASLLIYCSSIVIYMFIKRSDIIYAYSFVKKRLFLTKNV